MARYEITNEWAPINFKPKTQRDRILQNCKNLLMCRQGEVPFDVQRGINTRLFDLPFHEMQERLLPELDRLFLWQEEVEVVSASAQMNEDGSFLIKVILQLDA